QIDPGAMRGRAVLLVVTLLLMSTTPMVTSLGEARVTHEVAEDGIDDILLIGNSYTYQNDLDIRLEQAFDDAGIVDNVTRLTGGGMRLGQHADNAETPGHQWHSTLTTSTGLEFVVLQDQSQIPSFPTTEQMWQNSLNGAIRLDSMIQTAGAETVFLQTWGRRNGDQDNAWRNPDFSTMQGHLESGYRLYAENVTTSERTAWIAPVGLAFQHIHDAILDGGNNPTASDSLFYSLYSSDGSHPSMRGSYLASCVLFATLTGQSTVGLSAGTSGIQSSILLSLQQAADATVFNETTNYVYPWQGSGGVDVSQIQFGANSGSNFIIAPGITTGIAVNITNHAQFDDSAQISIITQTGWNMTWEYGDGVPSNGFELSLMTNQLEWIHFGISVPYVEFGLPLAGSKHAFTVRAMSQHDSSISEWNFTIEVLPWHGAEIVAQPNNATVDPDLKVRVPVSVRNLGNEDKTLAVRIQPVDAAGNPLPGHGPNISFQENGWSVGIFETYNVNGLGPYSTGTVQLEFDSPLAPAGSMWVEFTTWSTGASEQISKAIIEVSILRQRNLSMSINHDCERLMPGEACSGEVTIQNLGNYADSFELTHELLSQDVQWITLNLDSTQFSIEKGGTVSTGFNLQIADGLLAGEVEGVEIVLQSSDGFHHVTQGFTVEVDVVCDWIITAESEHTDESNNITIAYTLLNIGNAEDGLDVTISSNILTENALLPPLFSEWDHDTNAPNHFIIHDIQPNSSITIHAWLKLPDDQNIGGTAEITLEIRSELEPSIIFRNTTYHEYEGNVWLSYEVEKESAWELVIEEVRIAWNDWNHVFISVIIIMFGSVLLFRAVEYRQRKDAEWALLHPEQVAITPEKPEDWMKKFNEKSTEKNLEISKVPSNEVISAAHTVLEQHDEKVDYEAIAELADDLLDLGEPDIE
ncbi:MAG: hypothetical protein VX627_05265, partial [Candidatus Thermoplasmatota archaeon]|nr:hypothetical protein [Candidatus Thermoplasmatota archaeon]